MSFSRRTNSRALSARTASRAMTMALWVKGSSLRLAASQGRYEMSNRASTRESA